MDMGDLLKAAADHEERKTKAFKDFLNKTREEEQKEVTAFMERQRKEIARRELIEQEQMKRQIDEAVDKVKKEIINEEEAKASLTGMDKETEKRYRAMLSGLLDKRWNQFE